MSVAIGGSAGAYNQKEGAVAMGSNAGCTGQGISAIAIGQNAGQTNQPANSIVINASGSGLNGATASAFYANPVRSNNSNTAGNMLNYNTSTSEISYTSNVFYNNGKLQISGETNITGGNVINFGSDQVKEPNAGKIGYGTFNSDVINALCIVGASPLNSTGNPRTVRIYDSLLVNSNVGIGTTNPTKPLEILGASGGLLKLVNSTSAYQGGQSNIEFWNNNSNYRLGQISAIDIATSPNTYRSALALSASYHVDGFVEGMRIVAQSATSAFVGIGTITPLSFLEVKGSASTAHNVPPDGGASHNLNLTSTKTGTTIYSMALGVDFTSGAGYINAAGNGLIQPVCLQTRGGNVGIGKIAPDSTLHVNGTTHITGVTTLDSDLVFSPIVENSSRQISFSGSTDGAFIRYRVAGGNVGSLEIGTIDDGTEPIDFITGNAINRMRINGNGNVGIGTTTPDSTLQVNGTCKATTFVSGSDYRLKTNIEPLLSSRTIDDLKPMEYDLSGNTHDMGFIAHEVQEVFPFLVQGTKDGENMQSLNYTGFIALLVKEVQELKKENKLIREKLEQM